jgi:hypothetical protein
VQAVPHFDTESLGRSHRAPPHAADGESVADGAEVGASPPEHLTGNGQIEWNDGLENERDYAMGTGHGASAPKLVARAVPRHPGTAVHGESGFPAT